MSFRKWVKDNITSLLLIEGRFIFFVTARILPFRDEVGWYCQYLFNRFLLSSLSVFFPSGPENRHGEQRKGAIIMRTAVRLVRSARAPMGASRKPARPNESPVTIDAAVLLAPGAISWAAAPVTGRIPWRRAFPIMYSATERVPLVRAAGTRKNGERAMVISMTFRRPNRSAIGPPSMGEKVPTVLIRKRMVPTLTMLPPLEAMKRGRKTVCPLRPCPCRRRPSIPGILF